MLSDSDSESNNGHTLTINEHYAKAFQYKKEREELEKLKEKYGSDYSGSGSSDSEGSEDSEDTEEDSDGEELTPAVDAAILRTLARIRKKDPAIYEGGRNVFEEEHTRTHDKAPVTKMKTREKSKPITIREAALVSALADAGSRSPSPEPRPLTHTEEQNLLLSETRAAFHEAVDTQEDGDDDGLLVPRERTRDELEAEEEEYKAFLQREVGGDLHDLIKVDANDVVGGSQSGDGVEVTIGGDKEQEAKKKKGKKEREKEKGSKDGMADGAGMKSSKKTDKKSKEEANQEFLINYIFNRGWIDRSNRRVPTYNEIVDSSSKSSKKKSAKPQAEPDGEEGSDRDMEDNAEGYQSPTFSDEDSFDDLVDVFETSYNFRFEEPDAALISSFPRGLASARRESTTRKDARARKKERKEAEQKELLDQRRDEIRKERALAEAAIAEEEPVDNEMAPFAGGDDTSEKKKSKKQVKKEELARLKALKAKELRRKLEMVSAEGGLGDIGDDALAHLDLDADWDPSKHDAHMAELYGGDNDDVGDDKEKPTWDDEIDIDDIDPPSDTKSKAHLKKQKKKDKKKKKKGDENQEDAGVDVDAMDADLDTDAGWEDFEDDDGEWKGTEEERKRKVDAYMDKVVARLGFSGITSHMPTRFHYTTTTSENYGLTPAEILLATDKELNSYVGLKKLAPYRVDKGKKKTWDPKRVERLKEFRDTVRSRVGPKYEDAWSLGASGHRSAETGGEKKKRMGKKERARIKTSLAEQGGEGENGDAAAVQVEAPGIPKRKRESDVGTPAVHGSREDGVAKKKRRRRHKKESDGEVIQAAIS